MNYLYVAVGGFFGAIMRKFVSDISVFNTPAAFPPNIFIINLTGSFILGFFTAVTARRLKLTSGIRLAFGTGFLGAYTTFSAFSMEALQLLRYGQAVKAFAYIFLTALGCIFLSWLGAELGQIAGGARNPAEEAEPHSDGG